MFGSSFEFQKVYMKYSPYILGVFHHSSRF